MTGASLTGAGATLVVIDMQRIFGDPGSAWRAPRFDQVVAPIRDLASAYAPRVTFTRFVAPAAPQGSWRDYYQQWPFALQPPDAPVYDLVPEFASGAGVTVDATTFSKWGPDLAARVGAGTMVLAGVSTDCCVLSTALAAADAGVPVRVVAEACAGVDDESHAKALDIMALYSPLVEVIDLDRALALAGPGEGAWQGAGTGTAP
ncbi:MAG: cysteine hydrolase family protein [Streptosporangiaceae bacterium]